MKEITRINLASLPYNIEIEAKKVLEKYCAEIELSLGADQDAMREIEARMTELLAERGVTGEKVISAADVVALKAQLGEAKDFADEADSENAALGAVGSNDKSPHRLMRDLQNRTLGGVCAGIAAFFEIDTTMVRVGAVILAALSFGVVVPVYLLMWLIVPPARTAADRLQMAGKPVTLSALQHESGPASPLPEPSLMMFLRYFVAGLLLVGVVGTALVMAHYITPDFVRYMSMQAPWAIALTIIAASSGVLFMVMLGLLAYSLIAKKFTRAMGAALIIIMLSGLGAFIVGAFGLRGDYGQSMTQMLDQNKVEKMIDATGLVGGSKLVVNAPDNQLYISYVANGEPSIKLSYDKRNLTNIPKITATKNGDTVTLTTITESNGCPGGTCMPTFLHITGPTMLSIASDNGNVSYTVLSGQGDVAVAAGGDSRIDLHADQGLLKNVTVSASGDSLTDVSGTPIQQLSVNYGSGNARVLAGNLDRLIIQTPTVCAASKVGTLMYAHSSSITVNDTAVGATSVTPCFHLQQDIDGVLQNTATN